MGLAEEIRVLKGFVAAAAALDAEEAKPLMSRLYVTRVTRTEASGSETWVLV